MAPPISCATRLTRPSHSVEAVILHTDQVRGKCRRGRRSWLTPGCIVEDPGSRPKMVNPSRTEFDDSP